MVQCAEKKTHSILGYVHKPYPPIYAHLVTASGMDTSLLVRGVEGGVIPSLRQKGLMISYQGSVEQDQVDIDPKLLDIYQDIRAISFPSGLNVYSDIKSLADYTVKLGKSALSGEKGLFYDGLVLAASLILWHTRKASSLVEAACITRSALDSGKVLSRL